MITIVLVFIAQLLFENTNIYFSIFICSMIAQLLIQSPYEKDNFTIKTPQNFEFIHPASL